jgi:hypothetical protein
MAGLAGLYDWINGRAATRAAADINEAGSGEDYRLRALPKEEIDLFVKRIDNSRLQRKVDTRDFVTSIGVSGGAALASVAIILLLAPGVYNLLATRSIAKLEAEHAQLMNELRILQAREGAVFSAGAMRNWQEGARFVEPTSASVVYAPPADTAVASVRK